MQKMKPLDKQKICLEPDISEEDYDFERACEMIFHM